MAELEVKSEIAGVVFELSAAPGAAVDADEILLLVESMKMEVPLTAPRAARLSRFTVEVGDTVGAGDVVAVLDL